jgi:LemA protein
MLFGIIVFLAILLVLFSFVTTYNGLVAAAERATRAWTDLDALLTQRHDEIPKLIEMCEPHLPNQRASFERLLGAREAVLLARQTRDAAALGRAERAMRLLVFEVIGRAASQPELTRSPAFGLLRQRHTTLDAEIADRRDRYNEAVRDYMGTIGRAPGNVVAFVGQFPRLRPLEIEPSAG